MMIRRTRDSSYDESEAKNALSTRRPTVSAQGRSFSLVVTFFFFTLALCRSAGAETGIFPESASVACGYDINANGIMVVAQNLPCGSDISIYARPPYGDSRGWYPRAVEGSESSCTVFIPITRTYAQYHRGNQNFRVTVLRGNDSATRETVYQGECTLNFH